MSAGGSIMKPLPQKINGIKVLKDLGMIYSNSTSKNKYRYLIAECPDCLNGFRTSMSNLKHNGVSSCKECFYKKGKSRKHGGTGTRLYYIWISMRERCTKKSNKSFNFYGARGIRVSDEWKDFSVFKSWALENGYIEVDGDFKDRLSIDRIDNNRDYEPDNCQWITVSENAKKAHIYRRNNNA